MGENERAQGALETILRHNPYHVPAMVRLGHLLHNQQQYMQAAELYQKAIGIMEASSPSAASSSSSSSPSPSPLGNFGGPIALANAWAALAHCWLLLDDLPKAFNAYQQALGCPGVIRDPTLWFGIGLLYDRYGADEHALEAFSAVLKLDARVQAPSPTTLSRSNSISSSNSNSNGHSSSTGFTPNSPLLVPSPMLREVYYRIGMLLRNRKKYAAALECFEYVSQFPPAPLQRSDVRLQQAFTLDLMGDLEGARRILESSSLLVEGRKSVAMRARALLGWVLVKSQPGTPAEDPGLAMLQQTVQDDPSDALASYFLGRAYFCRRMFTQSYEAYQESVYRDGQNVAFWNSIGILYLETKQYRDALDAFSRAIHQSASVPEVWWNLGILYEACNNQLSDAVDAYQRAAELAPSDVEIAERLAALKASVSASNSEPSASASASASASVSVSASAAASAPPSTTPSTSTSPSTLAASPLQPTHVREIDPLPFMTRPILLGAAIIPPQKLPAPTLAPSAPAPTPVASVSPIAPMNASYGNRMSVSAAPRPRTYLPASVAAGNAGIPLGITSGSGYRGPAPRPMVPSIPHMAIAPTSYTRHPDTVMPTARSQQ